MHHSEALNTDFVKSLKGFDFLKIFFGLLKKKKLLKNVSNLKIQSINPARIRKS